MLGWDGRRLIAPFIDVIGKPENPQMLRWLGQSEHFLRKRQAHLKRKSSASESFPVSAWVSSFH